MSDDQYGYWWLYRKLHWQGTGERTRTRAWVEIHVSCGYKKFALLFLLLHNFIHRKYLCLAMVLIIHLPKKKKKSGLCTSLRISSCSKHNTHWYSGWVCLVNLVGQAGVKIPNAVLHEFDRSAEYRGSWVLIFETNIFGP